MHPVFRLEYVVAVALLAACTHGKIADTADGGRAIDATAPATAISAPAASEDAAAFDPRARSTTETAHARMVPTEARRTRLTRLLDDRVLAENAALVQKHFGGTAPQVLLLQTAEVGDRRAILVADGTRPTADSAPLLLLVDEQGKLAWAKERPSAGILPPVGQLAIAPGPQRRVVLAACDPPTSSVALRIWDEDGSPFADFQALEVDACEQLSILYWPRHGWIVTVARKGSLSAQLLTDSGTLAWGHGMTLGSPWRAAPARSAGATAQTRTRAAAAALVLDTDESFLLVQYGDPSPPATDPMRDHALAFRYDSRATPMWPEAVDLGVVGNVPVGSERIVVSRPREGMVHVTLGKGPGVDIRSNGEIAP